ncbi:sulfotransferase [Mycobacterium tilburgii]|uniref:sulfotransferase n=1 Tax=Mycobacterium tilburgii TaxID=44467 RepID=UPI0011823394|nr:sulfotransferase [Mycobacterium tilburgii]
MSAAGSDIADLDFDDLASPRLTDTQRQILEFTEARRVDLVIDRILVEAIDQAGADNLADTNGFGDRLRAHVAAIEAVDGLRQLTRSTLRQRVVRLLRNGLSLNELITRYPEIESITIDKPFIVVGMPRSGTTHLVNLIAADPRRRALLYCAHCRTGRVRSPYPRAARARVSTGSTLATPGRRPSPTRWWPAPRWWRRCTIDSRRRSRRR